MKMIAVKYNLSVAGQKADILAGGSGAREQTLYVEATPELVALATVAHDGALAIDAQRVLAWYSDGNHVVKDVQRNVALDAPATSWEEIAAALVAAEAQSKVEAQASLDAQQARAAEYARETAEREARNKANEEERRAWERQICKRFLDGDTTVYTIGTNPRTLHLHTAVTVAGASRSYVNVPADLADAVVAEIARRKAQAELPDLEWIARHGSTRLQKCVAAGMLDACRGLLRDERFAIERPGWEWDDTDRDDAVINPSEAEIDALLAIKAQFPDAWLVRVREANADRIVDECDEAAGERWTWTTVIADEYAGKRVLKRIAR